MRIDWSDQQQQHDVNIQIVPYKHPSSTFQSLTSYNPRASAAAAFAPLRVVTFELHQRLYRGAEY